MPLLQPRFGREMEVMREILTGSPDPSEAPTRSSPKSKAQDAFNNAGLSIEETVSKMASLAGYTEDDRLRNKIYETSLQIHGALAASEASNMNIQINFVVDGEIKGFSDILFPRSTQSPAREASVLLDTEYEEIKENA